MAAIAHRAVCLDGHPALTGPVGRKGKVQVLYGFIALPRPIDDRFGPFQITRNEILKKTLQFRYGKGELILTDLGGIDPIIGQPGDNFLQTLLMPVNIGICLDLRPVDRVFIFFKIIWIARGGFYLFNNGSIRLGINAIDTAADIEAKLIRFDLV